MRLPGNLRATTLGDLLGLLHRAGCSGTLELVENRGACAGRAHRVHLESGLVREVETGFPVLRLGDILVNEGFLSKPELERSASLERAKHRLGQILLSRGMVTRDVLSAALRFQLRRRLDSLFTLKDAVIRFRVPRPRGASERAVPLSPREFLFGRPRARSRARPNRRNSGEFERQLALRTLGLGDSATPAQIQQAFRALAQRHHPDRFPTANAASKQALIARFQQLSAAYHTLMR